MSAPTNESVARVNNSGRTHKATGAVKSDASSRKQLEGVPGWQDLPDASALYYINIHYIQICGINPVFLFTRQAEELKAGTAADARPFQVYMLDLMYRTPRVDKILAFGGHATDYLMHFPRMYLGNT